MFLNELQNKSAWNTARLQHLSEKPAEEQDENLAILVTNLIESVHKVALKTSSSTSKSTTYDQQQEKNSLKLLGHSPQITTIAHDQKRTEKYTKQKNRGGRRRTEKRGAFEMFPEYAHPAGSF